MEKYITKMMLVAWLFALPIFFLPQHYAMAGDLSFLSFDNKDVIDFDLSLKQYIASFKGNFMEKEKGLKSLASALIKLEPLMVKAQKNSANTAVLGRLRTIKGLLIQAQGVAQQNRLDESKEFSIPIRTELYELHRALGIMNAEDAMIMFHNGVLHRAEPLIAERRYLELEMLIPLMEDTLAKFKNPPKGVTNIKQYNKRYDILVRNVNVYIAAIREMNKYVDPEYGGYMLSSKIFDAHTRAHKKFGAVYLSFPQGMVWPKTKK